MLLSPDEGCVTQSLLVHCHSVYSFFITSILSGGSWFDSHCLVPSHYFIGSEMEENAKLLTKELGAV